MGFKLTTLDVRVQRASASLSTRYWNSLDIRWLIFVWTLNLVFLKGHTQCTKLPFCKVLESWLVGSLTPFFFFERLTPGIEPATCCFWWKALVLAPSPTSWTNLVLLIYVYIYIYIEREREREHSLETYMIYKLFHMWG